MVRAASPCVLGLLLIGFSFSFTDDHHLHGTFPCPGLIPVNEMDTAEFAKIHLTVRRHSGRQASGSGIAVPSPSEKPCVPCRFSLSPLLSPK